MLSWILYHTPYALPRLLPSAYTLRTCTRRHACADRCAVATVTVWGVLSLASRISASLDGDVQRKIMVGLYHLCIWRLVACCP